MSSKFQFYSTLAEQTINDLTANRGSWTQFLNSAAWMYKYPFQDQLMIYAQRPDATACAELELWNEKFNRWVRRGAKGIALIDDSGSYPRLQYVFDVSDTEPSLYRARPVQLWEMKQVHKNPILAETAKNYEDVSLDGTLADTFRNIATQLAREYYEDNYREILLHSVNSALEPPIYYDFAGTAIEEADDAALRTAFVRVLANSVAYTVMIRCGLDPAEYFGEEDFHELIGFNTPEMATALGAASSNLSEQVLRDIEITIRKYERVKKHERSEQDYDRNPYLHPERGLSASQHQTERAAEGTDGAAGLLRPDEENVPQRTPADNLQPTAADGETVSASEGSGRSGDSQALQSDEYIDGTDESARQRERPDGMDGGDERLENPSGGNGLERTDIQLTESETSSNEEGVFSLVKSSPAAFSQVGKSFIAELVSTTPITLDEVDTILRDGGNFDSHNLHDIPYDSRSTLRIAAHFAKGLEDNTGFLKREYLTGRYERDYAESGKGFDFGNHRVCTWFTAEGIELAIGVTAKNNIHKTTIPWENAAARVDELMRGGQYVSRHVYETALDNERSELAEKLWNFYHDDMHIMPDEWKTEHGGYPEDVAHIKSLLEDDDERQSIRDRLEADINEWSYDAKRPRSWHNPYRLLDEMNDAMFPPVIAPEDNYFDAWNFSYFITQDEIDALLTRGGNYSEGKFRLFSFFLGDHDDQEKLAFVKREYGHGGGTWSQTDGWYNAAPGKGIVLQRGSITKPDAEVNLKWNAVIKRIERLINEGRYMTRAELDYLSRYERLMLVRQVNMFYYDLPGEYDRPFPGKFSFSYNEYRDEDGKQTLDFTYPREAEWQAISELLDNQEHLDAVLAQMQYIFQNTSTDDRYYSSRKSAFEALSAYREGTYTLFPGFENLPGPETAARLITPPATPRREEIEDLRDSLSGGLISVEQQRLEQLSLFDPFPELPSVDEQRERINHMLRQVAEQAVIEAEAQAPALSLSDDTEAPFLNISGEDKARIVRQFTDNPRSREAVSLVREIYGDNLGISLPQAVRHISKLVAEGKYAQTPPAAPAVIPDEPVVLDFGSVAQTVLERVMADADYAETLAIAQSRASLRNPCTWVLEQSVRDHEIDEPEVYRRYFSDDDFNDSLFDYVLRQSWANRAIPDTAVAEQPKPVEPFAEITEIERFTVQPIAEKLYEEKRYNFRITDDHLGEGGAKTKFRNNLKALQTLKDIELENRPATPEEQEILSRYVGWGGLPQAFDSDNKDWANEYLELKALLTPEEWNSARASTLNAHYTSPTVIKAIYDTVERLGFKSGNILEPSCGIGNFFGLLPDSMEGSKLYGVELDSVTARIARLLYPNADIQQMGYEKNQFSDAFFDLAIGNVPFGGFGVIDKRYKTDFRIHDYFFQKTLDKVRPGGIIAFITSKGTLDKQNPAVRKYIAQRAELLGAVRLPNNTFLKNAGTEVTTDIIFLQKRDRPIDIEPEWVHLGLTEDGLPVNRYFLDNPEMMLGTMANGARHRMYGSKNDTSCVPIEGADLAEQLKSALSYIQGQYTVEELDDLDGVDDHAIPADPNVKNFSYTEVDGTVYFRENSLMYPVDLPAMTLNRIKGMIGLRDCVQKLIALQLDEYDDADIKTQQTELSSLYDAFTAEFGLISSQVNSRAFNADSSYYLLSSLEILGEDGELERKADMFTKRTIKQKTVITHVDTASEALAVSLGEKACVDLEYMSGLTGFDWDKLLEDLRGVIFLNVGSAESQEKAYVTADEYLSGNVREKLRQAEVAAVLAPSLNTNVEALRAIQPQDLEAGEITVRLGATWIDPKYVQDFMYELFNTSNHNKSVYQVLYHHFTGEWQVTGKNRAQYSDINATVTYGTTRMNAYQILADSLNLRDVRVYDYKQDADGVERRELNKKETMLAQQKQEIIKQKFKDWLWQDPERRQTLVRQYNELFNSVRSREYDGSHITFSGINPEISLSKHQVDGVARHIYGGNTLYAHVVGAGKTFTMTAAAMESKRLGLCQKNLLAVPNHLTEQWAAEFLRLYPAANILVATKKDFEMRSRKKFCAKIATGDYDAVIIGHSQLEKIPMSQERQERQIQDQIWEIEEGIRELKDSNGERFSIKQLEKTRRSLENRLTKLLDSKKRDDVVTFEQLGVDRLFVDEAHNFKNLFLYTKMRNVTGLSTSEAQKSSDLFMKCRYMDELTGNKGVIFATGTPISNSMAEMYTMQRYLQFDTLVAKYLTHFDAWASIFGETVTSIELAPEGTGYRARTRFAKFHNLPELMSLFKEVADIQTADMLNLPVPEAKFENIIVEPSDLQKEMVQELSERAAAVHARRVDPKFDNMLKITTDGRKIGLDQRLINPLLPDFEGSKVNACTDKVFEIWNDTRKDRLTQLVFCDFSTPNKDGRFNVYDDIRAKLLERGIPESEIAFIHDADTETKKKELFAKVRQGKVRVLFGSTFKMGAGTNVQDRLFAIHDADCPWRPADLEQRSGRIIRQGNKNEQVLIYRYATSGTFDSYLWQTVQKKQEFIAQIMSSKSPVRSCEDVDETALSYSEIKALCAGNPLIAEKMSLDNELAKLRMLKSEHQSQRYRLEDNLLKRYPAQVSSVTERIEGIEKDIKMYAAQKEKSSEMQLSGTDGASASVRFPGMMINGVAYGDKEPAAKALLESCKEVKGAHTDLPVGEYMGFKMSLKYENFGQQINLLLRGSMTYQIDLGTDAFGNITRINNALDKLPERLEGAKSQLENLNKQFEAAKLELAKPFEQETELLEKEARLALLNADLSIDCDGDFDIVNDTESLDEPDDNYIDELDDKAFDENEPDGGQSDEVRPNYYLDPEHIEQAASAKSKPSILDGIRSFDNSIKNGVQGNYKSAENCL